MKRKAILIAVNVVAALAALAGILLLLDRAQQQARDAYVGVVGVEPLPTEALPREQRAEDWFVGDWAGIMGYAQDAGDWTDFGVALLNPSEFDICLLRVTKSGGGYIAQLGSSQWELTAYGWDGFTMVCTQGTRASKVHFDSIYRVYQDFAEGDSMTFAYEAQLPSSAPGSLAPETHILRGAASTKYEDRPVLLSYLPPASQRGDGEGVYPCWYESYEDMEGVFSGMFILGENSRGRLCQAAVLRRPDGGETLLDLSLFENDGYAYGARDLRHEDLTSLRPVPDLPNLYWPLFERISYGEDERDPYRREDATAEHGLYYELEYIPRLEREIKELQSRPGDIWTQREILARRGLIDYAYRAEYLTAEEAVLVPERVTLEPQYLPAASLAGIAPGDTLDDARREHSLHALREDELKKFGMESLYQGKLFTYHTDGEGLLLLVYPDGRIGSVMLYTPGYITPDGRQVGDAFERSKLLLYAKDARFTFGGGHLQNGMPIDIIRMDVALDRIWDETFLDVDGDGTKERLELSGRAVLSHVECGTRLGDFDTGLAAPEDYGTRATLSVYKDSELLYREQLPLYILYLLPQFCDKLQTDEPGKVYIQCETGGTGLEEPIYTVTVGKGAFRTEYLGAIDIYS